MNADNTTYASERYECMFFMLLRSRFVSCARIFPADEVIIHQPPDYRLEFVPSVAMLIWVPSWMIVARISGYSVNTCFNNCCFRSWRWLQ